MIPYVGESVGKQALFTVRGGVNRCVIFWRVVWRYQFKLFKPSEGTGRNLLAQTLQRMCVEVEFNSKQPNCPSKG